MNIRVGLVPEDPSVLKKYQNRKKLAIDSEQARKFNEVDLTKAYIELDTGGEFDYLPEGVQEKIKEYLTKVLKSFSGSVMAALGCDLIVGQGKTQYGRQTIEEVLKEVSSKIEKMEVAGRMARLGLTLS